MDDERITNEKLMDRHGWMAKRISNSTAHLWAPNVRPPLEECKWSHKWRWSLSSELQVVLGPAQNIQAGAVTLNVRLWPHGRSLSIWIDFCPEESPKIPGQFLGLQVFWVWNSFSRGVETQFWWVKSETSKVQGCTTHTCPYWGTNRLESTQVAVPANSISEG